LSIIDDPGAEFFSDHWMEGAKIEKRSKKERKLWKGTPVETDAARKIEKVAFGIIFRRLSPQLEKVGARTL
jgi:hypothetical protein